jgi:hypothetical protein
MNAPQISIAEEKPIAFCFRCGVALKRNEIFLSHKGRWIKWELRQEGEMTANYCKGCIEAIETFTKGGIQGAIKRKEDADKYM